MKRKMVEILRKKPAELLRRIKSAAFSKRNKNKISTPVIPSFYQLLTDFQKTNY
jgi:hypothetical protein